MNSTQTEILNLLKREPLNPATIANRLKISRQALHRQLKVLLKENRIKREGSTPHIVYSILKTVLESRVEDAHLFFEKMLLPSHLRNKSFEKNYKHFCSKYKKTTPPNFAFMLDSAAVYSSNIEGNSLNLNSFLNSRNQNKKIRPKEAQEIEDLVKAYRFSQAHPLNEKNMLKMHAMLGNDFLNKARCGIYRKEPVGVFSSRGLEYLAIEQNLVENEMKNLFNIIVDLLKQNMTPTEVFFWAAWIHLMMVLIHPFSDGNGRISRLCEKWFLVEKLGQTMVFLPSEEFYFKNRPSYYSALKLGVNYWETNFNLAGTFMALLPNALNSPFPAS